MTDKEKYTVSRVFLGKFSSNNAIEKILKNYIVLKQNKSVLKDVKVEGNG